MSARFFFPFFLLLASTAGASSAAVALEGQIAVEQGLLDHDLGALNRISGRVDGAIGRLELLKEEFVEALLAGVEDPFDLDLQEEALEEAELTLTSAQSRFRKLRSRVLERRQRLSLLTRELARLEKAVEVDDDGFTGSWDVVVYPGQSDGVFKLQLEGTLIGGTYQLAGSWSGSLRGHLAGDRVRLERWDSERGFDAVFYARFSAGEGSMKGSWQSTDLASGGPASGTWVARLRENPR